ncbi:hypothetical protein Prudu_016809 [Prunus dulcis]|uniref:Uncharacterized protein n=1 Tax=Prunus dulcis TaxID=3755 RepID=A0A4Y1RM88_PRUDU|nr:hypothetical protein Prudu_016809 [Prunus dulcis]
MYAEDLSTIGGIATVSLLHSFIPTHWLPFSIVGRAQKWTLSRTLFVTAFGAVLHVISTSILGITAVTMANTIAGEETVHKLASLLLVVLGGGYILLFLTGKGGHSHSHNQPMEKMAVAGLVLVPALSPCATTLPHHNRDDFTGCIVILWCQSAQVSLGGAVRQTSCWVGALFGRNVDTCFS